MFRAKKKCALTFFRKTALATICSVADRTAGVGETAKAYPPESNRLVHRTVTPGEAPGGVATMFNSRNWLHFGSRIDDGDNSEETAKCPVKPSAYSKMPAFRSQCPR